MPIITSGSTEKVAVPPAALSITAVLNSTISRQNVPCHCKSFLGGRKDLSFPEGRMYQEVGQGTAQSADFFSDDVSLLPKIS